jgi:hypothetical protein
MLNDVDDTANMYETLALPPLPTFSLWDEDSYLEYVASLLEARSIHCLEISCHVHTNILDVLVRMLAPQIEMLKCKPCYWIEREDNKVGMASTWADVAPLLKHLTKLYAPWAFLEVVYHKISRIAQRDTDSQATQKRIVLQLLPPNLELPREGSGIALKVDQHGLVFVTRNPERRC